MTTTDALAHLELYLQCPLDDGEALLLLPEEGVCLELGQLPDADDAPAQVRALVAPLRTGSALLAVARTGSRPRPADLLLWTELCTALAPTRLLPLEVLPAAR